MLVPGNLPVMVLQLMETDLGGGAGRDPLQQELWGSHPSQLRSGKAEAGKDLCQGCPCLIQEQGHILPGVSMAGVANGR